MRLSWIFVLSFFLFGVAIKGHTQLFPPVAVDDTGNTTEDIASYTFNITDNDTDADILGAINPGSVDLDPSTGGDQTSLTTSAGQFNVDGSGNLTYVPAINFNGQATLTYTVRDNFTTLSNVGTVTINVASVNDPPTITGQDPISINESDNFVLTFGHLDVADVDLPAYPTGFSIVISSGSDYTFTGTTITPNAGFFGTLTVPVQVNDGTTLSPSFDLSISVNDVPLINGQEPLSTNEEAPITLKLADLHILDGDDTGFTMTLSTGSNYSFSGLQVTPAANFVGTLTVPVQVNDGQANSNVFNLSITVNNVNDAPVIASQNGALSTQEETPILLTLTNVNVNDPDLPAYPTGFTMTVSAGSNYTFSGLTITPAANYVGTLSVPVTVNDGSANSNTFNLSITVTNINDAPVIASQNGAITTPEDTPILLGFSNVIVNDPDLPAYPTGFSMTLSAGANYTFSGLTVTPASNYSGPLTVPVVVNDGSANSNVFNLSITVNAVNDPPVINGQDPLQVNKNSSITLSLNDIDVSDIDTPGYPAGFTMLVSSGANYTFSGLVISPTNGFVGTITVPVQVNDGSANSSPFNLSITVSNFNTPPVIDSQDPISTNEDQQVTLNLNQLNVTDPDTPPYPNGFTMTVSAGSNYTFSGLIITPAANFSGTLTVPVQVNDGTANSNVFNLSVTVNPINDAPVINSQAVALTTTEDTAIILAPGNLNVTDIDNPGYPTGFTMTVAAGANYTFTGLTVTPAANYVGTLTIPVHVNDGAANSNTFNLSVTVTAVNDAPVIASQDPLSVNEDESILLALTDLNVTDIDSPGYPAGFTMTVSSGANYTFSGLTVTPTPNFSGTLTVPVTVNDGAANSNVFNLTITVVPQNDLPTAVNDATSTTEDVNASLNVVTNDTDGDGTIAANTVDLNTTLAGIQGSVITPNGTFSVNSVGLVTFTPNLNFFGIATTQYTVNDNGGGTSNAGTITITVSPVNDAPIITGQGPLVTTEDQNIIVGTGDLTVTDVDNTYPTGFSIVVSAGANYTFSGTTITPATNFSGTLTVPVQVNDGAALSASVNITITVNPVNDAPTIVSQNALTTLEDQPITLAFANLNVTDIDNTYPTGFSMAVSSGANYTFSGLIITPAANFSGTLTVPVVVNDGTTNSNTFNLSITVTPVNDAPSITGQNALSVNEDQPITIAFGNLIVTDVDNTYPAGFTMTLSSGANYTFAGNIITPNPNFVGTLTVPVRVSDGAANSNLFSLSITVNPVNDPPVINSQVAITTSEDTPVTIQFTHLNVTDIDNAYPTGYTLSVSGGSNYSVAGTTVTPALNFSGTLTVPVVVNDGVSNSNTFNLIMAVNAVNDAPVINSQSALSVNEDNSIGITLGDLNVTDVDNTYPTGFTLTVLAGPNYTFSGTTITPTPNFSGVLTVPVRVNDGTVNSANFNLTITVNPFNDAPTITSQTALSVTEDNSLTIQLSNLIVTDPDNSYPTGFTLTVAPGTNYTVVGNVITPNANFTGTLTVPVQVNDGVANSNTFNLSVTVAPANDVPVITGQVALSVNEDNSITLQLTNLTVTDPDDTYPSGFTLTVLSGSNYTFSGTTITPTANFSGTLTVPVKVNDGSADSAPFNLTITVTPVNDAPSITSQQPLNTNEEQALTILLSNLLVTDPDNTYPTGFTLTVFAGTNYTFSGSTITPANNFTGTLTVPVRVNDGTSNSNTFNLAITVNGINDPPVITGQSPISVNEDNQVTIQLSQLSVTDPDNSYPAGFTLTVSPGANYTISGNTVTPAANFTGTLTIPVTVNDGTNNSASHSITVTVNPVNDVPQITGQNPLSTGESQPITIALSQLFVLDPDDNYPTDFSLFVLSGANYSLSGNVVTPAANFSGLLLVKVLVNDGTANSSIYDLQILVNSVNDAPVINSQQALNVNEDNPITIQFANLNVTDPDNTYPTGFNLIVSPGANYTFSGTTVTPAVNFTGTLTVSVKVNDGLSDSAPFSLQITVNPVNDAPQITSQQPLDTNEDTQLAIQFANLVVVDPDNTYPTGFTITVLTGTNYTISGTSITPATNFTGTLTVPVTVNDGTANSNNFNLQVTVNPVNDPPVITSQVALSTAEDTPITIKLADLIVTDPDDNYPTGFTFTVASGTNYTVSGATVTPALNFNGTLTVNVTVNDGAANSALFPLQVLVSPVNTPPVITGQVALSTNEDSPITIEFDDLTVSDPDNTYPNGFSLILAAGANYMFSGTTITPAANFNGNLTIPVRVNDGVNTSAPFNLLVKVNPVNDRPVITAQSTLTINEDQSVTLLLSHLTVTDVDNTYPTGFTLSVNAGTNYTVSGTKVTPVANFTGNLMVNVTVNDGTESSAVFQVLVKVNPVNDAPVANGIPPSVIDEDNAGEVTVSLLASFTDVEDASNALTYQITANDNPTFFQSIAIVGGELKYKVKANVFGIAKITIRATDTGGLTVQDLLTITINGINDAPSLDLVANQQLIENSPQQVITLTNVTKGPFENTQNLNLFATSGNTTIVPNPVITYDGTSSQAQLSYTVQPNKSGTVVITIFAIDDGSNTLPHRNSFSTTFQIEVVEINNQPTLDPILTVTVPEDADQFSVPLSGITAGTGETQTLTITATHSKPDILSPIVAADVVYTSPQNTGSLKLKPVLNGNGTVQVTVTVTDSGPNTPAPNVNSISRQFNVVVQAVNDLPVFDTQPVVDATVGVAYSYAIKLTDVDNASIALTAAQKPAWATLTVTANGKEATLSGTPSETDAGDFVVKIQAKDATGVPVVQEYTLHVNTLPVLSQIELTTLEDVALPFQQQKFNAAFVDVNSDLITKIRIVSLPDPELGVLRFNGAPVVAGSEIPFASIANLVYQPMPEVSGVDTIGWNAFDGHSYAKNNQLIRIVITSANDTPTIDSLESDPVFPLAYDIGSGPQPLTFKFMASDLDADSLVSATIRFSQNYDSELDELTFTPTANIQGNFDILKGELLLSGKAPASEYNEFMRGLMYSYKGESLPADRVKIVSFTVSDGRLPLSETKDRYIELIDEFRELAIATGFTPNGDEKNEIWEAIPKERKGEFPAAELKVYDKRGKLLFETVGFEKDWDGTFKGEPLPVESYFFTIDLKLPYIEKLYKGVVTIVR